MTQPKNTPLRIARPVATADSTGTPTITKVSMIVSLMQAGVPLAEIGLARDLTAEETVAVLAEVGDMTVDEPEAADPGACSCWATSRNACSVHYVTKEA